MLVLDERLEDLDAKDYEVSIGLKHYAYHAIRPLPWRRRMRYPTEETAQKHERVIEEAARLFREKGFDGVNVAEIMKAAGLTHGTFYAHFDSKEALEASSVERAMQQTISTVDQALKRQIPRDSFLNGYLSRRHRDSPGQGCAIAALAPEVGRAGKSMRAAFTWQLGTMLDRMATGFQWKSRRKARQDAAICLSTIVGALIIARSVSDRKLSDEFLNAGRRAYDLAEV